MKHRPPFRERVRIRWVAFECLMFWPAAGFAKLFWKGGLLWLMKRTHRPARVV